MKNQLIIVAGHPRSGTHLIIDIIRQNIKDSDFPSIRPSYATIENLILPHDYEVLDLWVNWLERCKNKNLLPIIKTHCLPSDIESFIRIMKDKKESKFLNEILNNAIYIYIKRDPVEALKSWFEFAKGGGVAHANEGKRRLEKMNFSNFLEIENLYKMPYRNWSFIDKNVIYFIAAHHIEWQKFLTEKSGIYLNFADIRDEFDKTSKIIFQLLSKNFDISIAPNDQFRNPFSLKKQNKINNLKLRIIKKIILIIGNIFPLIKNKIKLNTRVQPLKKLNFKPSNEEINKIYKIYDLAKKEIKDIL
tara:strand:- start:2111 stop:3022 length:912 start_codon:yes stop_codon:yes gene_type:complete